MHNKLFKASHSAFMPLVVGQDLKPKVFEALYRLNECVVVDNQWLLFAEGFGKHDLSLLCVDCQSAMRAKGLKNNYMSLPMYALRGPHRPHRVRA